MKKKKLDSFLRAFVSCWAILWTVPLRFRDPIGLVLFALLCLFFWHTSETVRATGAVRAAAALYTLFTLLAAQDRIMAYFESRIFLTLAFLVLAAGWYILFGRILSLLCAYLCDERLAARMLRAREESGRRALLRRHILLISFCLIALAWLPWFLYSYPGIFDPDPINQIEQVLSIKPYNNHHPYFHTLLIGACYRFGRLFSDDMNFAIACYTAFQALLLAFACAFACYTLERVLKLRLAVIAVVLAFFAFMPFMPVQAVLVGKDSVFAATALLYCCVLCRVIYDGPKLKSAKGVGCCVVLNLLALCFCLFRTNGWYAYIFVSLCFLIAYRKRLLTAMAHICPALLIAFLLRGPYLESKGIEQSDFVESLHVPIQQVACVIARGHFVSDEDMELLRAVTDIDRVSELYVNWFADNIKELIRAGDPKVLSENKGTYFLLWLRLGLRHPLDYLSAWTGLAGNIFYPDGDYDVAAIEGVYPNDLRITQQPLIHASYLVRLRAVITRLGDNLPLYGFLWSMGSYSWLLILGILLIVLQKQDRKRLLILMPAVGLILTLFLAIPSAKLFRYAFSYIVLTPFVLCAFVPLGDERLST